MERRSFLLGLVSVAGATAIAATMAPLAEATPLDQLRNLSPPSRRDGKPEPDDPAERSDEPDDLDTVDAAGEAPDGTPIEEAQYWRRRYWRRRRRRVCRRYWTRWGWRRRCWWRYG